MWQLIAVIGAIVVIVFGGLFIFIQINHGEWEADYQRFQTNCLHAEGHVYHMENVAYFCLTTDGRMLEVGP